MEYKDVYSPLYKTRRTLKFLRWIFGFPLQTKDGSYTTFQFVSWIECFRYFLLFSVFILCHLYWIILLLVYDGNLDNFYNLFKKLYDNYSTSKVDQVSTMLWLIIVLLTSLLYLLLFKYNTQSINKFCKAVTIIESKMKSLLVEKLKCIEQNTCCRMERSTKSIFLAQFINLITSVLFGVYLYLFVEKTDDETFYRYGYSIKVIYPVLYAIQMIFCCFGPISSAVELILYQMINSLSDLFEYWTVILRHDKELGPQINNGDNDDKYCHTKKPEINVQHGEM